MLFFIYDIFWVFIVFFYLIGAAEDRQGSGERQAITYSKGPEAGIEPLC